MFKFQTATRPDPLHRVVVRNEEGEKVNHTCFLKLLKGYNAYILLFKKQR